MKNDNLRTNTVHVRFSNDEYLNLKNRAKEAGMSQSRFLRECFNKSVVRHISNGKEIVKTLGNIHNNFQNYHNDMARRMEDLTEAINKNSELLQQHAMSNSPEFMETFKFQRQQISAISKSLIHHYSDVQRLTEENLHNSYGWIVRE